MKTANKRLLSLLLATLLLVLFSFPSTAATEGELIFNFDKDKPTASSSYSGFNMSFNTDPANANSEKSMYLEPLVGYARDTTQLCYTFTAGTFKSDGVVFWGKSQRYEAILDIIFELSWRDSSNTAHSSTYFSQKVLTNNGRDIVIKFDECGRRFGEEINLEEVIKDSFCRIYIRYYSYPEDNILSPIWLDTLRQKTASDVESAPVYGPPNSAFPADPDTLYTPSAETTDSNVIFNMSTISNFSGEGLIIAHNSNPAKSEAGYSLKITPTFGDYIKLSTGIAKGKFKGSGFKIWARSESKDTIINVQLQLSDPADPSVKGWYGKELSLTPEGKTYEILFKDMHYVSGKYINRSKSARANFSWFIMQYYNKEIDTVYLDTMANMPLVEANEDEDPVVVTTVPTVDDTTHDMSVEYNWDLQSDWKLDWSDEFNDGEIDRTVWSNNYGLRNSAEAGYFTDREVNCREENGQLVIETLEEDYQGLADYTSAELVTKNKKYFLYGRLEIRAKLPGGMGMWPAFWTLGNGVWPTAGEIDILEMIGGPTDSTRGTDLAHFTLHYADNNSMGHLSYGEKYTLLDGKRFNTDYHTIGMIWTPNEIKFYVDDHIYCSIDITDAQRYKEFHQPHYALINTSVGSKPGGWARVPDETTFQERQLYQVDYIRYYTYNGPEATAPSTSEGETTSTKPSTSKATTTTKPTTTTTTPKPTTTVPSSGQLVFADFEDGVAGATSYSNNYISKVTSLYGKANTVYVVDASAEGVGTSKALKLLGGNDYGLALTLSEVPSDVIGFKMKVYTDGGAKYTPKLRLSTGDITCNQTNLSSGVWNTCEFDISGVPSNSVKIITGLFASGVNTYYDDFEWIYDPASITPQSPYETSYKISDGFISGVNQGDTVSAFKQGFTLANDVTVTVKDSYGNVALDDKKIATGMTVVIASASQTYATATVVVYGDINGDGNINSTDVLALKQHILCASILDGAHLKAAIIKKSSVANSMDLLLLKRAVLGFADIEQ